MTLSHISAFKHPKIQVDSQQDISFLIKELKSHMQCSLVKQQQQSQGSDVSTQDWTRVEDELNQWIDNMFGMAGKSIQINGVEYEDAVATGLDYEPLDEDLILKGNQMQEELNSMLVQVTKIRKRYMEQVHSLSGEIVQKPSDCIEKVGQVWEQTADIPLPEDEAIETMKSQVQGKYERVEFILDFTQGPVTEVLEDSLKTLQTYQHMVPLMVNKLETAQAVLNDLGVAQEAHPVPLTPSKARVQLVESLMRPS